MIIKQILLCIFCRYRLYVVASHFSRLSLWPQIINYLLSFWNQLFSLLVVFQDLVYCLFVVLLLPMIMIILIPLSLRKLWLQAPLLQSLWLQSHPVLIRAVTLVQSWVYLGSVGCLDTLSRRLWFISKEILVNLFFKHVLMFIECFHSCFKLFKSFIRDYTLILMLVSYSSCSISWRRPILNEASELRIMFDDFLCLIGLIWIIYTLYVIYNNKISLMGFGAYLARACLLT